MKNAKKDVPLYDSLTEDQVIERGGAGSPAELQHPQMQRSGPYTIGDGLRMIASDTSPVRE